jgi:iron complex outermembrane receptor protein
MHACSHRPRATFAQSCTRVVWVTASVATLGGGAIGATLAAENKEVHPLEEIIVTAQKREERLHDVPISISVLSGAELDQLTSDGVLGALERVPGVVATAPMAGSGAQLTVRGVSAGGATFNGSSPIAYYLDSVPFGLVKTAIVPDSNIYDLNRVEVLRGPQGTLYGASAQNGVVRVLTNDANPNEFEMKARTSLSATEHGGENYRGDLAINVPIVEGKLAARAVVGYEDASGWIDKPNRKDANDAELRNLRLKINAEPTDQLSIGLLAWVSRADYGAPSSADEQMLRSSPEDESIDADYDLYGLKLAYEAAAWSITSNTGYLDYSTHDALDLLPFIGFSAVGNTTMESQVFSEEIIVNSSADGPWLWSLGGMYRDAEDLLVQITPFPPLPNFTDKSESFAHFGQVTRKFLDGRFEVTAGLRYFEDSVTQIENEPQTLDPNDPVLPPDKTTFDATSPRVVLAWHPVSDSTVYASYSEGFRSGFNQNANVIRTAPEFPPVKADTLNNYELGAKGVLAAGRFTYDVAVYYMDWRDVQQTLSVLVGGIPTTALVNGESASGFGGEFAIMGNTDAFDFGLNFGWNELEADSALTTAVLPLYVAGERLNYSPEYTAGALVGYRFAMGAGYKARWVASGTYVSSQTYRNILDLSLPVFVDEGESELIARTSLAIESPHGWTAVAFIDNVNDENAAGPGLFGVPEWVQRSRPRTYGVQLEFRF